MDPNDLDLSTIGGTVNFFFLLQIGSWNSRDKSDIVRSMGLVSPKKKWRKRRRRDWWVHENDGPNNPFIFGHNKLITGRSREMGTPLSNLGSQDWDLGAVTMLLAWACTGLAILEPKYQPPYPTLS